MEATVTDSSDVRWTDQCGLDWTEGQDETKLARQENGGKASTGLLCCIVLCCAVLDRGSRYETTTRTNRQRKGATGRFTGLDSKYRWER